MHYFTPGPSHPYPKLHQFMDEAFDNDVVSWSHRSGKFSDIYRRAESALRELLDLPDSYHVLFVGSATEAMERTVQGLARTRSHHYVLGAFGKKWQEIAGQLGKTTSSVFAGPDGDIANHNLTPPVETELLCVTMNETSIGSKTPDTTLKQIGDQRGNRLLALDIVSAAPLVAIDWSHVDVAFFSVQKAFGLPAGLGVLIINDTALEHAEKLEKSGLITGSYHSLVQLARSATKAQTPETPNVLGIYLLARVAEDMAQIGPAIIRKQTTDRAQQLYATINANSHLLAYINSPTWRSSTVIVADILSGNDQLLDHLKERGLLLGTGYAPEHKTRHVRIANFPALNDDAFGQLVNHLENWQPKR